MALGMKKEELRSFITVSGELFVMIGGSFQLPMLHVVILDFMVPAVLLEMLTLVPGMFPYYWTMYVAVVMKILLAIVLTMDGESIIVVTMKMHQLSATVSATIPLNNFSSFSSDFCYNMFLSVALFVWTLWLVFIPQ